MKSAVVSGGRLTLAAGLLATATHAFAAAEDELPVERAVRTVLVEGTVDSGVTGRVTNIALELQAEAEQRDRDSLLVLQLGPGVSRFAEVRELTLFLISARVARVRTVCWVPETVVGPNAIIAIACNEIVMHPDAELGDFGRGRALAEADLRFVEGLVEDGHNTEVNAALARGLGDPSLRVVKATVGDGDDATLRTMTTSELRRLRDDTDAVIRDVETVKEPEVAGKLRGRRARSLGVLAAAVAESRGDLAERYGVPQSALKPDLTAGEDLRVAYIKLEGVIEPVLQQFVNRQIDRAVADGANLVIVEIDSPGGLLLASEELSTRLADLEELGIRTVAYVPEDAYSGAAIIALGCDQIYMHPNATIGDAGPIETQDGQAFARAPEKVLSQLRKFLADMAERKGRPPAVCEAMADKDLEVFRVTNSRTGRDWYLSQLEIDTSNGEWVRGEVVAASRENNLLTVGGDVAHELKIAEPPVADKDELRMRLGIPPGSELEAPGLTWLDTLIFVLNTPFAMAVLVALGIIFIYIELHFLTGLCGILSVTCFGVFFWAKFLGGTAGWLEVVLFVIGLGCLLLEVFVLPGFGVFGVTGGLLVLASLIMASQTFGNLSPDADFDKMTESVGYLSGSLVAVMALAFTLSKFLPSLPLLKSMILAPPGTPVDEDGVRLRPDLVEEAGPATLVGKTGLTATMLRPSGKAEIDGEYVDVVSEGPLIDAGAEVEVVRVEGYRVVVRRADA